MPDAAELAALVAAADALAGILDDEQIVAPRDRHDRIHVAGGAPHMNRHDGPRARADRRLDRLGIDGYRFVDVDDQRNGADR